MGNLLSRLRRGRDEEIQRAITLDQLGRLMQGSLAAAGYYSPFYSVGQTGSPTERPPVDFQTLVTEAFAANPIIYGLVTKRSLIFSEARLCWQEMSENGHKPGDLAWDDGLRLLENPWPNGSMGELLGRIDQDVSLAGNAYIVNEGDRLRRLRPDWVQIVLSGNPLVDLNVDVLGYIYGAGSVDSGTYKAYLPDEVAHISPVPDPLAQYRGMSWLTPVLKEVQADKAATEHKLSFLRNGGILGPVVKPPPGTTLDQFKKFVEAADARHAGPNNSGRFVFLAPGSDVQTVATDLQRADVKALTASAETRMTVAALMPAVIAGVSEGLAGSSLNSGNYQAAKRQFADGTLRPLWRITCAALENILDVPEGKRLWFDEAGVAFLREDQQDVAQIQSVQAQTITSYITGGWKPDTARDAVNENDLGLLEHTGLTSVQLTPPGTTPGQPGQAAPSQPDTQGEAAYQQALQELRASRAAFLDAAESIARATGPWSRHPHPGQRYRHGFIPVAPVALLSPDMLDGEFGRELDSVDWLDHRLVAREHGVTVESPQGSDVAVHSVLSPQQAEDVADAIEQGQPYLRDRVEVAHHGDGVDVRFGGLDESLDHEQAAELSQSLRDLGYVVEDAENPPDEPNVPEPPGDETPIPDEAARSVAAALASLRSEVDEIRRG